jgi:hypothetical protein
MITVELVNSHVAGVRGALKLEPEIWPNIAVADTAMILAVIICLLERRPITVAAIQRQLEVRGCTISFRRIKELLKQFEGVNPRKHLWERLPDGAFMSLYQNAPHFPVDWLHGEGA